MVLLPRGQGTIINFIGLLQSIFPQSLLSYKNLACTLDSVHFIVFGCVPIWQNAKQENVIGLVLDGKEASALIPRAVLSPFYIQPIFRDDGHFMLVSQFFEPSHFIMAYLEDYKMDPAAAQPLMSFSVFEDYSDDKDLTLVRADVMNRGLDEGEGLKVVNSMLANYMNDDQYLTVRAFNSKPDSFDLETYVAQQSEQWKADTADVES